MSEIEYSAYEQVVRERDEARSILSGKTFDDEAANERARSARLISALRTISDSSQGHAAWTALTALKEYKSSEKP